GMQSIVLAIQTVASAGDEVIYLSPAWPNAAHAASVSEAKAVPVVLDFIDGRWVLDAGRLEAAITPKTRALFINTPSNPTGWTATKDDLEAILSLARRHGLWIIADEIYGLYYFEGTRAPSFMDVMDAFMQKGAIAALDLGDEFIRSNVERARTSRDILCDALVATNRVETRKPEGALYAFLKIDGVTDSRAEAFRIVDETGVGMAPGTAFGPGGAPFMRACFLRDPKQIEDAAERLFAYIRRR
ncbi:MAG: aminotransferase class I/II-fold pyridoxal phosphate-dependent enzyme, partial [Rhizobiaceae bacterium]